MTEPFCELDFSLEELNRAEGLLITAKTGDCEWTGESMDWDTGIHALMTAEFPEGVEWHEGRMRPCRTEDSTAASPRI